MRKKYNECTLREFRTDKIEKDRGGITKPWGYRIGCERIYVWKFFYENEKCSRKKKLKVHVK